MAKGIIYVMTTVVPGLVKIGKTQTEQLEKRMYNLEHNGYANVAGLKRRFAIEVEDYDEKERMLDDVFSKSRVPNTELFAADIDLVVKLLSSLEGRRVFPEAVSKEESFKAATAVYRDHIEASMVPDGTYYMERKSKKDGSTPLKASVDVYEGSYIIRKGQRVSLVEGGGLSPAVCEARQASTDKNGVVLDDVELDSPSAAAAFVIGGACNGWSAWKTKDGKTIDVFRRNSE